MLEGTVSLDSTIAGKQSKCVLTLSSLSFWNGLFYLWIWTHQLSHVRVLVKKNDKLCRSWWDGSLFAVSSGSRLFAKVSEKEFIWISSWRRWLITSKTGSSGDTRLRELDICRDLPLFCTRVTSYLLSCIPPSKHITSQQCRSDVIATLCVCSAIAF